MHSARDFLKFEKMIPQNIRTLLLLIGVAGSLASCKDSCGGDFYYINEFVYRNATDFPVEIVGYTHPYSYNPVSPQIIVDTWVLESGKTQEFRTVVGETGTSVLMPLSCDSVRLIFDKREALIYRASYDDNANLQPWDIYNLENYIETSTEKNISRYTYTITEAQYDTATPIASTTE